MNIFSALELIAFVSYVGLGIFVLQIDIRSRRNQVFCLMTLSFACWALGYVFMHSAPDEAFYRQWLRLSSSGWVFTPPLVLHFFILFTRPLSLTGRRWLLGVIYLPAFAFLYRALTATVLAGTVSRGALGWIELPDYGSPWFFAFTAYYVACTLLAFALCWSWSRRPSTSRQEQRSASVVVLSGLLTLAAVVVVEVVLPLFVDLPDTSSLVVLIWAGGTSYAILRQEFMQLTPAAAAEGILATMSDPVLLIDAEGKTLRVNQATLDLLHRSEREVVGRPWQSIFGGDQRVDLQGLLEGPLTAGPVRNVEMELRTRAGETVPVMVSFSRIRSPERRPLGVVAVCRDITDRKRADRALRDSEERYRALYADIPSTYFTIDPAGTVLSVNAYGASELGYTVDELVGGSVLKVFPPDQQAEATAHVAECLEHPGEVFVWELRKVRKDGSVLQVRETARAVPDQQAGMIVLIVCENVTERRILQQQLAQAQKMEAIGRLAGGVAHDFNNLLTAIRGFAELHLAEHEPGDPGRADVLEIEHAADRAVELTGGLLAFSRRAEVHATPTDLATVAREAVTLLRRLVGEHIEVRLEAATGLPLVLCDRPQIEQVLLNLAANARDAMPTGGTLRITVTAATLSESVAAGHPGARAGRHVLLAVSDTGVGMDSSVQARLFEPFFTTKPRGEGTGLGLASVYGIVQGASGFIDVTSRPGGGSVFSIYLPAVEGETPEERSQKDADRADGRGTEAIMLVEDEPAVRLFALRVLEAHGYRVSAFADPAVALDAAIENPTAYDALVTDVIMPAMSGPTLADRIALVRPGLPVLFMSGYEADALPAGAPRPLAKPFSGRDLTSAVAALFGREA